MTVKNGIKNFFRENYKIIIFFIIIFTIINFKVPYYIFTSGGITDLSNRFELSEDYDQEGSYNLSYVNQIDGNVLTYLLSYIMPDWEKIEVEKYQLNENETMNELMIRDKLSLTHANQTAVITAYSNAEKKIDYKDFKYYVYATYEFLESDKHIMIGDTLVSVDGNIINDTDEITNYIQEKEINDYIELTLNRNGETYTTKVKVKEQNGRKMIGILFFKIYDMETEPKITFKFKDSESGSSAGLMTTLAIYDALIPEDLTHGLKIAGTGTIEANEKIGEIGGIKYKLAGAVKDGADIFFAPSGENYEEAIKLKKDKGYKIDVVEVKTLKDAINYLKNLKG